MTDTKNIQMILLGAILLSPENYWTVEAMLEEDCFTVEAHKQIYRVIRERAIAGKSLQRDLVAADLPGEVGDAEPSAFLSMLTYHANKEGVGLIEEFAETLRSDALRKRIASLAEGMLKTAKDPVSNPMMILDRAAQRVAELSQLGDIETESTLQSSLIRAMKMADKGDKSIAAIQPCLAGMEELINFYPPGSLTLMGGGPGSGKTAFAMQQLIFTSQVLPSTLFEYEMDNAPLVARSLSEHTGVPLKQFLMGMTKEQAEHIQHVAEQLRNHKLRIVAPPKMSIHQLRSRALAHKERHGLALMVVDHLKLIERPSKFKVDRVQAAYDNAYDLKILAKELGCAIIALAQFTKAGRDKENPEPEMEDFYGGSLEEHADIILALFNRYDWLSRNPPRSNTGKAAEKWQEDRMMSENRIEVYKLKHRFMAPRGRKFFHWDGAKSKFSDIAGGGAQGDLLGDAA